jgi:2'-5' RNA ligase
VIDEIHLTVRIPGDLAEDEAEAVRDVLAGEEFMARLRRTVRAVVREFPKLNAVRASLTR